MNIEGLEEGRILAFQMLLDVYFIQRNRPTLKELFKDENFKYGIITDKQVALWHFYLMDEFAAMGLDLNAEIEKKGENIIPGKLSQFELDELVRRADQLIMIIGYAEELKDNQIAENK